MAVLQFYGKYNKSERGRLNSNRGVHYLVQYSNIIFNYRCKYDKRKGKIVAKKNKKTKLIRNVGEKKMETMVKKRNYKTVFCIDVETFSKSLVHQLSNTVKL